VENSTTTDTVADSAATLHFFPNENDDKNTHNKIEVVCANNPTMTSVATTELDIPELSTKTKTADQFNEMKQPLLSIPLLADDGCNINLIKNNIAVLTAVKRQQNSIRSKKRQGNYTLDDTNKAPQKS
jgi:hypothetical protein